MSFLQDLLEPYKVKDLLEGARPLARISKDDLVIDALKRLSDENLLSLPVWDEQKKTYLGFIDVLDIMTLIFLPGLALEMLNELKREFNWHEYFNTSTHFISTQKVGEGFNASDRNCWKEVNENEPLYSLTILMGKTINYHRVAVTNDAGEVIAIISQSRVIEFLYKKINCPAIKDIRIVDSDWYQKNCASRKLKTINFNVETYLAFRVLFSEQISGLPVVNDDGELIASMSASDIKGSRGETLFQDMFLPVSIYLERSARHFKREVGTFTISSSENISSILEKLFTNHIHRLFVVDSDQKPIGVLSLCDVIAYLSEL